MKKDYKPKFPIYSAINYFEAKSFENIKITSQMRSLYYSLLHLCMTKGGLTEFPIATHFISHLSKISSFNTLYKTLEALDHYGLIKYTKGKNRFTFPMVKMFFDKHTTTLLSTYYQAVIASTNVPTIKATINNIDNSKKEEEIRNKDTQADHGRTQSKIPFEVFWVLYQKEVGKADSIVEWNKLNFDTQLEIIGILPKYLTANPDKKYRKNPSNFLKQEGWKDEIIISADSAENSNRYKVSNIRHSNSKLK